jgi:predicted nucleotide-binding protein (sugar kinase/HSP70/actin superfamily)
MCFGDFVLLVRDLIRLNYNLKEILEFQKIVKSFTEKFDEVSKLVEKEKMKVKSLIKN